MNGLQLSDDPAIHVNELTYNGMAGWTLFRGDIAYPYSAGLTVDLTRSTSYCYDGTRMPPGNDDMRASVTRLPADKNASATAGGELAIVGPGVEEVGLRIYQRHSDGSWVMDGFFRRTYQPGEVRGAQHEWTTVSPEEADLILDRIFPTPPAIAPAP